MFENTTKQGYIPEHDETGLRSRTQQNKQYLTKAQTEWTELNKELMRPGEYQTQVKSINKNERQGYVQEHNKTEHKVD